MGSCCQSKPQGETSPTTPSDSTKSQPRRSKKTSEAKSAKQSFNGKTYACMSCKNGHRVRQCDHGYDRPVSATNQPGRPSSGSKRKCTCPKDCACHDKDNCKCERNCVCVEAMYLIVHVSKKGSPKMQHKVSTIQRSPSPIISRVNEKGQQEVLQKVYTDLTGKPLSDEETKRRNEEREKREQVEQDQKKAVKAESSTSTPFEFQIHQPSPSLLSPTNATSGTLSPAWNISSPSCCQHANNTQTPYMMPILPHIPTVQISEAGCNCGATCQCIHCPEHANNAATRQYNQQQFTHMANNSFMPSNLQMPGPIFTPAVPQASCMGGPTTFRLSTRPQQPTDLAQMFPDAKPGSYVMQYEIKPNQAGYQQIVPVMDDPTIYTLPEDIHVDDFAFDDQPQPDQTQFEFEPFLDEPIDWNNITIGEASVNQIPHSQAMQPNMVMPHSTPSTASGFIENIIKKGRAPPMPISQQPVRDRPKGNDSEPWMQDFTIDGPFMGHPASPVPVTASSPIHMGAF